MKFNPPCLKRHPGSSGNLNYDLKIAASQGLLIQCYLLEKALDMLVTNLQVKQLQYIVPIECVSSRENNFKGNTNMNMNLSFSLGLWNVSVLTVF